MNVAIFGATSAIAEAVSRRYAERGAALLLVGRNRGRLEAIRDDLRVRGAARAEVIVEDLDADDRHAALVEAAEALLGPADVVLLAQGALGDRAAYAVDGAAAARVLHTNLLAPASLLTLFAARMEARRHGTLAAIGSVAGDRGRASNYAYGAAKGGLALFLQGLRSRLARAGVHVLTVKPGFVDTPMTARLPKNVLYAEPAAVAARIVRAIDRREDVLYVPGFWLWILLAVRAIPERLFKRLSL